MPEPKIARQVGPHLIVRVDEENFYSYKVFSPSHTLTPESPEIDLMGKEQLNGKVYEPFSLSYFWEPNPQQPETSQYIDDSIAALLPDMKKCMVHSAFPETSAAGIADTHGDIWAFKRGGRDGDPRSREMSTSQLDDMLVEEIDIQPFIGWRVRHEFWSGELVRLNSGKIVVKVSHSCAMEGCRNRPTIYLGSGVGHGAFCLVFTKDGHHVGDLTNGQILCTSCARRLR